MAKYVTRVKLSDLPKPAAKPMPKPKAPAPSNTAATLRRGERIQALEAKESLLLKRGKPDIIRTTVTERTTPMKKR